MSADKPPLDRLVPPTSPPAAVRPTEVSWRLELEERRVLALERIADALERAHPPRRPNAGPPPPTRIPSDGDSHWDRKRR